MAAQYSRSCSTQVCDLWRSASHVQHLVWFRSDGVAMTVCRETFSFVFQNSEVPARSGWFGFKQSAPKPKPLAFPAEDVAFLRSFSNGLNRIGLILPDRA